MTIARRGVGIGDSRSDELLSSSSGVGTESDSEGTEGSGGASEVDSGMESNNFDLPRHGESGGELCQVGSQSFLVPYELYDLSNLSEILSVDVWNDCLTEEERVRLSEYLPDMDQEGFMLTLRELFGGNNFQFGSPVVRLFEQLKAGLCEPSVVTYRRGLNYLQRRKHCYRVMEYHNSMVGKLVQIRDVWEDCAGYGIKERLHVLKVWKSGRRLGSGKHGRGGLKVEADESVADKWNKRRGGVDQMNHFSDLSALSVSHRSRLDEEPIKGWKEELKGALKIGSSKAVSKKGPVGSAAKVGHAVHDMGPEKRGVATSRGSLLDPSRARDYGSRVENKLRDYHGYEFDGSDAEEEYEMDDIEMKAKNGKSQLGLKRRHGQLFPADYGDEGTRDHGGLSLTIKKKNTNQISAAEYNGYRISKKSRHIGKDMGDSVMGSPEHLAFRGERDDGSRGKLHSQRDSFQKEALSMGHHDGYPERGGRKKQLERDEYMQKPGSHVYSDRVAHSPAWDIRRRYSPTVGRDADYISTWSSDFENEETNSDSSERVEKDDVRTHLKKSKQSNVVKENYHTAMYRSLHDPNDAKNNAKWNHKHGGALSLMPEEEPSRTKGQKNQTRRDIYVHGFATETSSPVKLSDAQKYLYEMVGDHYGGRSKSRSAERTKKGLDLEFPWPVVHDHSNGNLKEDGDGGANAIADRVRMDIVGNPKTEFDSNGQLCVPLSGCRSLATKRKLDKSRHHHYRSDKVADSFISKKGKRNTDDGLPVALDLVSQEKEVVPEPEVKPSRKPFTPITPTVHTGFSFSIVHLLSAVRKAMISTSAEDASEMGNDDNRKDHADANPCGAQKGLPSLTVQEIVSRVRSNPGDPSILETQEPLQDLIRGVIKIFSSKTAPLGAKAWKPLVSYESSNKSWSWIGPVPLSTSDPVEEETSPEAWDIPHKMLVKLVDAFANWLKSGQETLRKMGSLPPPPVIMLANLDEKERFKELRAQKSLNTITVSPDEVRKYFRQEEFLRYQIPERAFSYTAGDGKKSIVAPLRRGGGKPTSKARDHFMLKPDRPPHVTVLCLVRDAAARLPGSIGTRADVCTLIRDSQYIVEDVSDSQVNQVVSGALDRLHYERDPCVQYDSDRKLWVYLHRDREEEDFEDDGTSSTKKWKRPRRETVENADAGLVTIASHNVDGDQDAAGTSGYEFNSDPTIGPSSTGEKAELVYSDLRSTSENVEPLTSSVRDSSHQGHRIPWDIVGMNSVQQENQMLCQQNCTNEDFEDESFGRGRPVTLLNTSLL